MKTAIALILATTALAGCSNNNDEVPVDVDMAAVVVGATADYTTASHAVIDSMEPHDKTINLMPGDKTDVVLSAWGSNFYRIERLGANSITKYDIATPDTPIWQCSTEGDESNSNPYQLVQVAANKAYVLRYGSAKIWVVDPYIASSAECTNFKTAEIDLSAFDDDAVPDMSAAVVVDNRLFVAIQRLTFFTPSQDSQVVVIDTATDQVVDVDSVEEGVQAITLVGKNPGSMIYVDSMDKIFVQSVGKYDASAYGGTAAEYSGGIDVIDPTDFTVSQLIDDTETGTKQISGMAIIDADKAFLVNYAGWGDNSLYAFNPTTGEIAKDGSGVFQTIDGFAGVNISGAYAGPDDNLWVTINSGVAIIDTTTGEVSESLIDTEMNPSSLVFVTK
jgi:hypothetical protein